MIKEICMQIWNIYMVCHLFSSNNKDAVSVQFNKIVNTSVHLWVRNVHDATCQCFELLTPQQILLLLLLVVVLVLL